MKGCYPTIYLHHVKDRQSRKECFPAIEWSLTIRCDMWPVKQGVVMQSGTDQTVRLIGCKVARPEPMRQCEWASIYNMRAARIWGGRHLSTIQTVLKCCADT